LRSLTPGEDTAWGTPLGRIAFDAGLRHDLRSITKSITSILLGVILDRGLIKSLDEPVFSYFPEYADLKTPEKAQINLRHLLTMSSGLAWNEYIPYSEPANSERRMMVDPDRHRYVLKQPSVRPAGAAYNYNGGLTALLGAILQRMSGSQSTYSRTKYSLNLSAFAMSSGYAMTTARRMLVDFECGPATLPRSANSS
jgi:Beta-lactamase